MSRPYYEWILLAQRWDRATDFGSPTTAWSQEMLKQRRELLDKQQSVRQKQKRRPIDAL